MKIMSEKKQTAVMWLLEQQANMPNLLHGHPTLEEYQRLKENINNQALQMEREHTEESLKRFLLWTGESQKSMEIILNQYYTDTYGE